VAGDGCPQAHAVNDGFVAWISRFSNIFVSLIPRLTLLAAAFLFAIPISTKAMTTNDMPPPFAVTISDNLGGKTIKSLDSEKDDEGDTVCQAIVVDDAG